MASSSSETQASTAKKSWDMTFPQYDHERAQYEAEVMFENIGTVDEIYRYDRKQQQDILNAKPWEKE